MGRGRHAQHGYFARRAALLDADNVSGERMKVLTNAILRRAFQQHGGGGLMNRIAAAGILRLALRWPALTVIVILSIVAARIISARRRQPDYVDPALGAPW